jgi:hypothetical protein
VDTHGPRPIVVSNFSPSNSCRGQSAGYEPTWALRISPSWASVQEVSCQHVFVFSHCLPRGSWWGVVEGGVVVPLKDTVKDMVVPLNVDTEYSVAFTLAFTLHRLY